VSGGQEELWSEPEKPERAHARATDPETSRDAAASVSSEKIRGGRLLIYRTLVDFGPMIDDEIYGFSAVRAELSPSGARTRRSELVSRGLVVDSGARKTTRSGRQAIVWAVAK
jgi:hypothetical protein